MTRQVVGTAQVFAVILFGIILVAVLVTALGQPSDPQYVHHDVPTLLEH